MYRWIFVIAVLSVVAPVGVFAQGGAPVDYGQIFGGDDNNQGSNSSANNPTGSDSAQNPTGSDAAQNPTGSNATDPGLGPQQPAFTFEKLPNPLGGAGINDISGAVGRITDVVLMIAIPFITLAIIYSGFRFVSAQGNAEKLKEARKTLFWTLVGALVLMGSYTIANAIINTVEKLGTATADTAGDVTGN